MPQPTTAAWMPAASTTLTQNGMSSGYSEKYAGSSAIASAAIAIATAERRWTATLNSPISAAPPAAGERLPRTTVTSATPTGQRRRSQIARQASTPAPTISVAAVDRRLGAVLQQRARAVDAARDRDDEAGESTSQSRRLRGGRRLRSARALGRRSRSAAVLQPRRAARGGRGRSWRWRPCPSQATPAAGAPHSDFGRFRRRRRRGAMWPAGRCAGAAAAESAVHALNPPRHIRRPRQALRRHDRRRRTVARRPRGDRLRPARPQRRRQDHRDPRPARARHAERRLHDAARRAPGQPRLRRRRAPGRDPHRGPRDLRPRDPAPEHADRGVGPQAARRRPPDRRAARARRPVGARRHAQRARSRSG